MRPVLCRSDKNRDRKGACRCADGHRRTDRIASEYVTIDRTNDVDKVGDVGNALHRLNYVGGVRWERIAQNCVAICENGC